MATDNPLGDLVRGIRESMDDYLVAALVHGVSVSTERAPERADMLMSVLLDGLRARGSDRRGHQDSGHQDSGYREGGRFS